MHQRSLHLSLGGLLTICLGYGGRQDLVEAARRTALDYASGALTCSTSVPDDEMWGGMGHGWGGMDHGSGEAAASGAESAVADPQQRVAEQPQGLCESAL